MMPWVKPSDEIEPGCIADEFEKGYMMHGRLLRPAKVIVATAPVLAEPTPEENSNSTEQDSSESKGFSYAHGRPDLKAPRIPCFHPFY